MLVRNEADIVRVNLLHHLAQGIDRFLVVDNGSTDGTDRVLAELARGGRVRWTRDDGPYRQAEITTELAREAFRDGADWVLPIDADEFWYAPGGDLRRVLAASPAGALQVQLINFVQRRAQLERSPTALLHMTRRHVPIAGVYLEELMEGRHMACRDGLGRQMDQPTHGIHRDRGGRAVLEARMVDFGQRALELERPRDPAESALTWRRLALDLEWATPRNPLRSALRLRRLVDEHGLEKALEWEWAANSYSDDCLDVYGVRHQLVYDTRLRDLVAPWVEDRAMPETGAATRIVSFRPRSSTDLADGGRGMPPPIAGRMPEDGERPIGSEMDLLMTTAALALAGREACSVLLVGDSVDRLATVVGQAVSTICPKVDVHVIPDANPVAGGTIRECIPGVSSGRPIGLHIVDGPRDYAAISRAVADVDPLLIAGDYVAFGEYDSPAHPAVTGFVNELFSSGHYRKVRCAGRIAVAQKPPVVHSPDDTDRLDSQRPTTPDSASRVLAATAEALREGLERAVWVERRSELGEEYHLGIIKRLWAALEERTAWAERMVAEVEQRGAVIAELQAALATLFGTWHAQGLNPFLACRQLLSPEA